MGEQGAKTLRGGKMEDVIFAGTSGRSPLGRAEVVLTIDNSDGALPIDYTEVTISRTMFRSGGSEYAINGSPARLLDVQDLLSDSGIGREMHVIVGQGQLDSILQATPEIRRGFIEEAAGVLKHRKRKEKAERKLEATAANLNRLNDLLGEIRRQLKPLGRQAEVARKAVVIQAELRDAKARLLADELVAASGALESELAAEAELKQRRLRLEDELTQAREAEQVAEAAARDSLPQLTAAQETWYALAGLAERVASTASIAGERLRNASSVGTEDRPGRDPEAIEREAADVRRAETELQAEVAERTAALAAATEARNAAEVAHAEAEKQYAAQQRAIADRREGLARLAGEVNTLRSRAEAAGSEIERLTAAKAGGRERAPTPPGAGSLPWRPRSPGSAPASPASTTPTSTPRPRWQQPQATFADLQAAERAAAAERGAAAARAEALALGLERRDGSAALLAAGDRLDGLLGSVAALISVRPGSEVAIAAALGAAADAVAVTGLDAAVNAFGHLKAEDLGRAGLLLGGDAGPDTSGWPHAARPAPPTPASWWSAQPTCVRRSSGCCSRSPWSRTCRRARELVAKLPDITAVTADGDVLSAWFAAGGSSSKPSLLEVQAALDEANARLGSAQAETERLRFAIAEAEHVLAAARERSDAALARLHESDAAHAALAEEAGELNQTVRSAQAEAGRLAAAAQTAAAARDQALASLGELEARLELASVQTEVSEADPTERDRSGDLARAARSAEMDARLALRTVEERARALAGRAESLTRAAEAERAARAKAAARREQLRREAEVAAAVQVGRRLAGRAGGRVPGAGRGGADQGPAAPRRGRGGTHRRPPARDASSPARSRGWSTLSTRTSWPAPSSR